MDLEIFINRKIKGTLNRWFGIEFTYGSETKKVRHLVIKYCVGKGCDIGFGGDKIVKQNCDGIDFPNPYAKAGRDKVDIGCDIINGEIPVADNTYDYVYTSHLIKDFTDTIDGLKKFIRVLKNGGNLILVFPNQKKYEEVCNKRGQPLNPYHVHQEMGLAYMTNQLNKIENIKYDLIFKSDCEIDYNVVMVLKVEKL